MPLPARRGFSAGCRTRSEVAGAGVTGFSDGMRDIYQRRYGKWVILPDGFAVCFDPFGVLKMQEMGEES